MFLSCIFSCMCVVFRMPLIALPLLPTSQVVYLYCSRLYSRNDRIGFFGLRLVRPLMFTLRRSALRTGHAFRPTFQARLASTNSQSPQNTLKKGLYTTAVALSTGLFVVYYFDSRSAIHRYIITPTLRYALDPEASHRFAVRALASGLGPRDTQVDDERLRLEVIRDQRHFGSTR